MKKLAALPISVLAAIALSACGDDSVSDPGTEPVPTSQATLSSEALPPESSAGTSSPATSSESVPPTSSASVDPGSSESVPTSSAIASTVEFTDEAVALPDFECVTEPVTYGSGFKVSCGGTFLGNVMDDDDATAFDPNAASYADFVGIQKVFAALQPTDKVVFVMRHAHRTNSTDADGVLTGLGYLQAEEVGKKIAGTEDIKYWHSEVPRTMQTCMAIAKGRGQATFSHKALSELNGGWFEKDHAKVEEYNASVPSSYEVISRWAYGEYRDETTNFNEGFYDLETRGEQFMKDIIVGQVAPQSRISVVISHDQMLYPLVIYVTNRQFEMRYHEDKSWLNFLAGVAVIIKADGSTKYVPLKGLDSGLQ